MRTICEVDINITKSHRISNNPAIRPINIPFSYEVSVTTKDDNDPNFGLVTLHYSHLTDIMFCLSIEDVLVAVKDYMFPTDMDNISQIPPPLNICGNEFKLCAINYDPLDDDVVMGLFAP